MDRFEIAKNINFKGDVYREIKATETYKIGDKVEFTANSFSKEGATYEGVAEYKDRGHSVVFKVNAAGHEVDYDCDDEEYFWALQTNENCHSEMEVLVSGSFQVAKVEEIEGGYMVWLK